MELARDPRTLLGDREARGYLALTLGLCGAYLRRLGPLGALTERVPPEPAAAEHERDEDEIAPPDACVPRGNGTRAGMALALVLSQVVIWRFAGAGYFWPEWVMLPLALGLAIHAWVELVVEKLPAAGGDARALAIHAGGVAALVVFLTLVWAVTSRRYFWPGWALVGLAIPLGIHALVAWTRSRGRLATRGAPTT